MIGMGTLKAGQLVQIGYASGFVGIDQIVKTIQNFFCFLSRRDDYLIENVSGSRCSRCSCRQRSIIGRWASLTETTIIHMPVSCRATTRPIFSTYHPLDSRLYHLDDGVLDRRNRDIRDHVMPRGTGIAAKEYVGELPPKRFLPPNCIGRSNPLDFLSITSS